MNSNYQERPKGKTSAEASLDGGKTWLRLLPISFTAENAQKCFYGQKTQTRLLVNPQPPGGFYRVTTMPLSGETCFSNPVGKNWPVNRTDEFKWLLPAFSVGDIFYIREPWRTWQICDEVKPSMLGDGEKIFYEGSPIGTDVLQPIDDQGKLRPAMFLQRRFARPARYQVTEVSCERVNEISEADAEAEGIVQNDELVRQANRVQRRTGDFYKPCVLGFKRLWNSIHSEPGTRFEDGPWVWAYTFERVR